MHYIGDKPFVIDFAVVKAVCVKLNINLTEFEQVIQNPVHSVSLFYEGLKRGAKLEGKVLDLSVEQAEELLLIDGGYADFLFAFNEDVLKMFTPSKKK
jgi:hypothetical protein